MEGVPDALALFAELDRMEAEVQQVKVSLTFSDQLHQHSELVRLGSSS